ncbi:hypothetical protein C6P45_003410 [Maudiozyma exigua]|uniref:Uncharacterized protein n=1 Tax=Maudiozyma exigua TaxID=34358 RepID=A0A9P7B254_MAUEX|nr:hypothetical protein C6P45_003410 [Kazachstania exigua]
MVTFSSGEMEVHNIDTQNYKIINFDSSDKLASLIKKYADTETILYHSNSHTAYSDIKSGSPLTNYNLMKRLWKNKQEINIDNNYSWRQWNCRRFGSWWSAWYQLTNCKDGSEIYSNQNHIAISWNYTYTATTNQDISINWGAVKASFPWDVSYSVSRDGAYICDVKTPKKATIWYQQHIGWADYQKQDCHMKDKNEISCGRFSPYMRVDIPLTQENDYHIACSIVDEEAC